VRLPHGGVPSTRVKILAFITIYCVAAVTIDAKAIPIPEEVRVVNAKLHAAI
jgi:hypothetical protein